jgi:hypothetical protein
MKIPLKSQENIYRYCPMKALGQKILTLRKTAASILLSIYKQSSRIEEMNKRRKLPENQLS